MGAPIGATCNGAIAISNDKRGKGPAAPGKIGILSRKRGPRNGAPEENPLGRGMLAESFGEVPSKGSFILVLSWEAGEPGPRVPQKYMTFPARNLHISFH